MGRFTRWLESLLSKKCPECRSTRVYERNVFTMTYCVFYGCHGCGHEWKECGY